MRTPFLEFLLRFIISLLAGWLATGMVRRGAIAAGFVAHPNPIVPQHTQAVAYMGGVGIALGGACTLWLSPLLGLPLSYSASTLYLPALGFLCLGLIDDLRPLNQIQKLLGQIALAAYAVTHGVHADIAGVFMIDAVLSAFWIIIVVNAVNLTDVCDGLVGGLSTVSLLATTLLVSSLAGLSSVLAGATIGFLVWNKPPARIYLGDAGSHLLGFVLAAAGLLAIRHMPLTSIPIAALLVGVCIFELCLLIVLRRAKGIPFWRGSPDHFALRMQAAGLSRWATDLCAWTSAALMCAMALIWKNLSPFLAWVLLAMLIGVLFMAATQLRKWEVPPKKPIG